MEAQKISMKTNILRDEREAFRKTYTRKGTEKDKVRSRHDVNRMNTPHKASEDASSRWFLKLSSSFPTKQRWQLENVESLPHHH